ncbi:MAG: hypothetical protein KDB01_08040 [Planctomycetaceae bacterium]|nr:hypothetical protein [Planctomycetaceae bacterium]
MKTIVILALCGCTGSGSAPAPTPPTAIKVQFWEDPTLTIKCHITGTDQSVQDPIAHEVAVQPARPANVPWGLTYHEVDVAVTQGVSYSLTAKDANSISLMPRWDYNWSQDMDTIESVAYGSPRF